MELMGCADLAVPADVMHHVVTVESSYNPYAIGVVGGRLQRQPKTLSEALATVRMLERRGYNFSLGLAQVNRYNLDKQGLTSYERAFDRCANLQAGSRILAECQRRANDWGKAFSCYYSGNFTTGFKHGYVQKVYASMRGAAGSAAADIAVIDAHTARRPRAMEPAVTTRVSGGAVPGATLVAQRTEPTVPIRQHAAPSAVLPAGILGAEAVPAVATVAAPAQQDEAPTMQAAPPADAAFVF